MFEYPETDSHFIFGKYLAIIEKYKNGAIGVSIDDNGISYKNTFHLYSLNNALKQVRKDIRYLETITD
tara:strand:- start:212 stop:415 length:204 start_codon:yes stop_codon:yes gene_type:complete